MSVKLEVNETEERLKRVEVELEKTRAKFLFLSETSYTNRILAEGFLGEIVSTCNCSLQEESFCVCALFIKGQTMNSQNPLIFFIKWLRRQFLGLEMHSLKIETAYFQ